MKHNRQLGFSLSPTQLLSGGKAYSLSRNFVANRWRVEEYWSELFGSNRILKNKLTEGQVLQTKPRYGLIYTYWVDGKVRYVGRAETSIAKHFKRGFRKGLPIYNYEIKRCLLNAVWRNSLRIKTEVVPRNRLKARQAELIRLYSRCNRLWNKLHNPYFRKSNFDT